MILNQMIRLGMPGPGVRPQKFQILCCARRPCGDGIIEGLRFFLAKIALEWWALIRVLQIAPLLFS